MMHAQFGEDEVHEGDTFESLGCEDGGTVCVDCVALSASAGGDNEGPGWCPRCFGSYTLCYKVQDVASWGWHMVYASDIPYLEAEFEEASERRSMAYIHTGRDA